MLEIRVRVKLPTRQNVPSLTVLPVLETAVPVMQNRTLDPADGQAFAEALTALVAVNKKDK